MKHKPYIFFISLLMGSLLPFCLSAQPVITKSCNALRAGDHLVKQQVHYKDPGRAGENVLWDFSRQEAVNEHYELEYYGNPDSLLIGQEHRTLYKYFMRGDSLLLAGFENRTTLIDNRVPELLLVYPMQYGHKHEGYFHGGGDYCNQLFVGVSGKYTSRADAYGTMLLPSGDTLRHVLRTHQQKKIASRLVPYPLVSYADTVFCPDSVDYRLAVDTVWLGQDTYRWYADGYRYPVFETVQYTTYRRGKPEGCSNTAFFYTPSSQYYDLADDMVNQQKRERERALAESGGNGTLADKNNNGTTEPQRVIDYDVVLSDGGNTLTLEYFLHRDAQVAYMLFDMQSRQLSGSRKLSQSAGTYHETISLAGFPPGEYTLRIVVDETVYGARLFHLSVK